MGNLLVTLILYSAAKGAGAVAIFFFAQEKWHYRIKHFFNSDLPPKTVTQGFARGYRKKFWFETIHRFLRSSAFLFFAAIACLVTLQFVYVGISALKSVSVRRTCSATNVVRRRSVESIAADFLFQNPGQHAPDAAPPARRVRWRLHHAAARTPRCAFRSLDRDARQRMFLALLRGENDLADLNVYIVFILLLSPLIAVLFLYVWCRETRLQRQQRMFS